MSEPPRDATLPATGALNGGANGSLWLERLKVILVGRSLKRTLIRLPIVILVTFLVFHYALIPVRISGLSMEPTYHSGSINFINGLSYVFSKPRRGDIVAVMIRGRSVMYFKRIVALPGETYAITNGVVHINGAPLAEPYVRHRQAWQIEPSQIPDDSYLVIGDNRGMAQELHLFGVVKEHRLLGKVLW